MRSRVRSAKRLGQGNRPPDAVGSSGTRQRIILAARSEFAERGLDGARVDRIADRAGVNKAMIYYHFHSKTQLYEGVVRDFFQTVLARLMARTAEGGTLEEHLLAVIETHIHAYTNSPEFVQILLRELASPHRRLLDFLASEIRESKFPTIMLQRLREGISQGRLRGVNPEQALLSLITMSLGYLFLAPLADRIWSVADRVQFLEERKHAIVDLFLHGVLVR